MRRIFVRRRSTTGCRIAIAVLVITGSLAAVELTGAMLSNGREQVQVIDAGTLSIGGAQVRLFGIEAPARNQMCRDADGAMYACGSRAADFTQHMIGGKTIICYAHHPGTRAVCYAGRDDIGWALVRAGWAVHNPGTFVYVVAENKARAAARGMWSGSFAAPWLWRRTHSAGPAAATGGAAGNAPPT